jgi:hypothetical protein
MGSKTMFHRPSAGARIRNEEYGVREISAEIEFAFNANSRMRAVAP